MKFLVVVTPPSIYHFALYLSVGSESIETHILTSNGKLFNEWITQNDKSNKRLDKPNERSQRALFQNIISFFCLFPGGLRF